MINLAQNYNWNSGQGLLEDVFDKENLFTLLKTYSGDAMGRINYDKLARTLGLDHKSMTVTAGATEGIQIITNMLSSTNSVIYSPTFWEYEFFSSRLDKNSIKFIKLDNKNINPYESIRSSLVNIKDGLVYLCNPNNPTGHLLVKSDVVNLVKEFPNLNFIIDETYLWFNSRFNEITLMSEVINYENLFVVSSLSKIFSIPGLRIGLLFSNAKNIENINEYRTPYTVLPLQLISAEKLLDRSDKFLKETRKNINMNTKKFINFLYAESIYDIYYGSANFIFFGSVNGGIYDHLLSLGIKVRDGREFGKEHKNYVRLCIPDYKNKEWDHLIHALKLYKETSGRNLP